MNLTPLIVVVPILLLAASLAAMAWFAMAQVEEELRSFSGFEGMYLEI